LFYIEYMIVGKKLLELTIPDFINKVEYSKARRPKYYDLAKKTPKLTKKLEKGIINKEYEYRVLNNKKLLYSTKTNELVISNPKAVGTPNIKPIKGNDFYSGFATSHQRIKVVTTIKNNFTTYFKNIKPSIKYPLFIEFIYFDNMQFVNNDEGKHSQDLDNLRFAYEKCSLDLFKQLKKIVDDDLRYIRKLSSEFIPIDLSKDKRKIIIAFYEYLPTRNSDGSIIKNILHDNNNKTITDINTNESSKQKSKPKRKKHSYYNDSRDSKIKRTK
jgi:hypothetical protein